MKYKFFQEKEDFFHFYYSDSACTAHPIRFRLRVFHLEPRDCLQRLKNTAYSMKFCGLIRNIYLYRGKQTSLIILDAPGQGKKTKKNAGILSFTDVRQEGSGKREFPVFYEKERKSEPESEIPIEKKIPDRNQSNLSPHYETHFQATDTDGHEPAKTRQGTSYVPIQHRLHDDAAETGPRRILV